MPIVDSYMYVSFHALNINIMASHLGVYTQTLQASGFLGLHLQSFQSGSVGTGGVCAIPLPSKTQKIHLNGGKSSPFNNHCQGHNQVRMTRTLSQDTQIQRAEEKNPQKKPCLRQCKILSKFPHQLFSHKATSSAPGHFPQYWTETESAGKPRSRANTSLILCMLRDRFSLLSICLILS